MRVLLVEDSPTQLLRGRVMLQRLGFEVVTATDGRKALDVARVEAPDLILSDVLMPGMDGFQLCLEVRTDPVLRSTPVLLQTASFNADEDRSFARDLGADGYVDKNLSPELLGSLITKAIEEASSDDARTASPVVDERGFRTRYGQRLLTRCVEEAALLERANEALASAYDATLQALVAALDVRDTETELHSWRVTEYARTLGLELGFDREELTSLVRGSMLHDIGKIGVPDGILRKPATLDEDEWATMRRHPELGYGMLSHIRFLQDAAPIVLTHHERWDGRGYPEGLKEGEIPAAARIFAVADALDAITSDRPYRTARGFDEALSEIKFLGGTQFDPEVVSVASGLSAQDWATLKKGVEARVREAKAHQAA